MRNGKASTSMCTPAKGNYKVKIIRRSGRSGVCIRSIGSRKNRGDTRRRRGERRWRRGNQREGIRKDHEGREANRKRCSSRSQRKGGRGEEGRVLMEDDIDKSHIMTGVKKVYPHSLFVS